MDLGAQHLQVVRHYLKDLGKGRFDRLHVYFAHNAQLSTPDKGVFGIKGKPAVNAYFLGLDAYLGNPRMKLYHIYKPYDKSKNIIVAHFNMKIKRADKFLNRGEIVDIFQFKPGQSKIASLYIMNNGNDFPFKEIH
jgi:hypothetical protein